MSGARFVIRMKLHWGMADSILEQDGTSGTCLGQERQGQLVAALGYSGG